MQTKLNVEILSHTPEPEKVIATSAKLCYSPTTIKGIQDGLTEESVDKFLMKLMDMGHESPIEHVSFTFGIEGVSRTLLAQITRHRLASFSVKSQRYVKEGQFEYVIPKQIENNIYAKRMYIEHMETTQATYNAIVDELMQFKMDNYLAKNHVLDMAIGECTADIFKKYFKSEYNKYEKEAIEDARYILPNACETKIIMTMNARELLHFFQKRCCNRAQEEIRDLATEMLRQVKQIAPILFKNAGASCMGGYCLEGKMTCGKIGEVRKKFKNL